MMAKIFPHFANKQQYFTLVAKELNNIRKFRNKVFHFANIFDDNRQEIDSIIDKYIFGIYGKNNF